jgi:hypothetical protein
MHFAVLRALGVDAIPGIAEHQLGMTMERDWQAGIPHLSSSVKDIGAFPFRLHNSKFDIQHFFGVPISASVSQF